MTEQERFKADLEILGFDETLETIIDGHQCYVHRASAISGGHLCGYVEAYISDPNELDVHGGVTWNDGLTHITNPKTNLIGFDCAHAGDWSVRFPYGRYKDVDFVLNELKNLVLQLPASALEGEYQDDRF